MPAAPSTTRELPPLSVTRIMLSSLSPTLAERPSTGTPVQAGSLRLSTLCRMMPLWPRKSLLTTATGARDGLPPTKKLSLPRPPSISVTTSRPVDWTKKRSSPSAPSATSFSMLT